MRQLRGFLQLLRATRRSGAAIVPAPKIFTSSFSRALRKRNAIRAQDAGQEISSARHNTAGLASSRYLNSIG
jgi:hypothetical protein